MSNSNRQNAKIAAVLGSLAASLGISTAAVAQEVVNPVDPQRGLGPIGALESVQSKTQSAQGKVDTRIESVQQKISSIQGKDRGRPETPRPPPR